MRYFVVGSKGHGNQMVGYKVKVEGCSEDDTEIFLCVCGEGGICLKPLLSEIAKSEN